MARIPSDPAPRASARTWLFRLLAAVGIPAALLLGLELGLRLVGYGHPAGFLIPDAEPGYWRTNPEFVRLFLPKNYDLRALDFRIAARKPAGALRVVLLGESAAQGVPAPAFALGAQLRAQLRARYPGRPVEVLNTGIVAINSHVVYQVARDLARFSPDLFVVYMGNNEVVGPYGPGCAYLSEMPPLPLIRLSVALRGSRTGQLLAAAMARLAPRSRGPAAWAGMATFVEKAVRGDDPRLEAVYSNLAANLGDIVRVATGAGAKTVVATVVSNLRDCAPFLSLHRPGLTAADTAHWEAEFAAGRLDWMLEDWATARRHLEAARAIDPQYADALFLLGTTKLHLGDTVAARRDLVEAAHWDALRFRPDPRINDAVREVVRAHPGEAVLVDAARELGSDPESSAAPAGRGLLVEHVHLDWEGNYRTALLLAQGAEQALGLRPAADARWLGPSECAAAVGYSPHERAAVLNGVAGIVRRPPFTAQLTYPLDQARLADEVARAEAAFRDPAVLAAAAASLQAAEARDPQNESLAALARDVALDRGDLPEALREAQRARALLPADFRLTAWEATLLVRAGRATEAEALLFPAAKAAGDPELTAPALADFFVRTGRAREGSRYFAEEMAAHPESRKLALQQAALEAQSGDAGAARRDLEALLERDPGQADALEDLVRLLSAAGATDAIAAASLRHAGAQPGNQANNFRVAAIHEARGETAEAVRAYLAAERSGPVNAAFEIRLARLLHGLQRRDESLLHLALARRLARAAGDAETASGVGELLQQLRPAGP